MQKLIDAIEAERPARPVIDYDIGYNNGLTMAIAIVRKFAAEKKPARKGRWLMRYHGNNHWVECSECLTCGSPHWKVCPVCEIKMEVPRDGES